MRASVLAVGRLKAGPESDLVARYAERARATGRGVGLTAVDLLEFPESRLRDAEARKAAEAEAMLGRVAADAFLVRLDEGGRSWSSETLAARLGELAAEGRDVAFAIGGPDGHGRAVAERADAALSFGAATWPHQLVRVMLLEQLYRAVTLMAGHPYHRA